MYALVTVTKQGVTFIFTRLCDLCDQRALLLCVQGKECELFPRRTRASAAPFMYGFLDIYQIFFFFVKENISNSLISLCREAAGNGSFLPTQLPQCTKYVSSFSVLSISQSQGLNLTFTLWKQNSQTQFSRIYLNVLKITQLLYVCSAIIYRHFLQSFFHTESTKYHVTPNFCCYFLRISNEGIMVMYH